MVESPDWHQRLLINEANERCRTLAASTDRFGKRLLEVSQKGLTQDELAEAADLSRNCVNYVERRRRNVRLATIARLAQALGFKTAMLMPEERTPLDELPPI
jgi:transcriptional regulator with XRE-family HTH domain